MQSQRTQETFSSLPTHTPRSGWNGWWRVRKRGVNTQAARAKTETQAYESRADVRAHGKHRTRHRVGKAARVDHQELGTNGTLKCQYRSVCKKKKQQPKEHRNKGSLYKAQGGPHELGTLDESSPTITLKSPTNKYQAESSGLAPSQCNGWDGCKTQRHVCKNTLARPKQRDTSTLPQPAHHQLQRLAQGQHSRGRLVTKERDKSDAQRQ